ncbi:MAG TPA: signal peptide peptidase SppA [Alphaproteobacteria bacterium]|mgnify:CR=1 FL=1|nr:signal peptide peptidase SppA [Rhodospirillaceae bacterium]HRJ66394.1 signal peptide peptidase SppA [Alphaproteobacteria bacterium]
MSDTPQRRKDDKFTAKVWRFFYRFFFMVGVSAFISIVMLSVTMSRMMNYAPSSLPDAMVLTFALKSDLAEVEGAPSLTQPLLRPATVLQDVVSAIDLASKDARVKALTVKLEDMNLSAAQAQELRDALLRFRATGKRTYIYADSYGGFGSGISDYFIATAFDEIWLQPVGSVSAVGVASEVPFVKDLLDKVGVETQFVHQGIYKSAPESLTERGMTPPHREMMQSIVSDLALQMMDGIAKSRGLSADDVRRLVDESPYGEKESLRLKLVDRVGYYDEMVAHARRVAAVKKIDAPETPAPEAAPDGVNKETAAQKEPEKTEEAKKEDGKKEATTADEEKPDVDTVSLMGYSFVAETQALGKGVRGFASKLTRREAPESELRKKDKIALIYGSGEIVPFVQRAQASPFMSSSMAADKIVQAFRSVQADDGVAAVIFRIDSPGGSPEASETIRRAIMETRRKGKPVVVSMASTAASGGYWIAAPADKIIAQPGTLTGSIGVFGGKFVLAGLWQKLGINWDSVSEGGNAGMWSANKSFTPAQLQKFDALMAEVYDAFLERVAEGRKMPVEKVRAIAEGRVYTGRQAKDVGLVDDLGGLDVALKHARALGKIEDADDVPLVRFPPRKSTMEMFISLATEGALFQPTITVNAADVADMVQSALPPQGIQLRAPYADVR